MKFKIVSLKMKKRRHEYRYTTLMGTSAGEAKLINQTSKTVTRRNAYKVLWTGQIVIGSVSANIGPGLAQLFGSNQGITSYPGEFNPDPDPTLEK